MKRQFALCWVDGNSIELKQVDQFSRSCDLEPVELTSRTHISECTQVKKNNIYIYIYIYNIYIYIYKIHHHKIEH